MKTNVAQSRESAVQSMTPEGETKRVTAVHSDLAAKRNQELEKEVSRLRELLAIEREVNSAPRRAGRAEALEILARIDPAVVIERMTEEGDLDGRPGRVWRRQALESVLGVTPGNAVESLTRKMEDAISDASESLHLAYANLAALERTLQAVLKADDSPPFASEFAPGLTVMQPLAPGVAPKVLGAT